MSQDQNIRSRGMKRPATNRKETKESRTSGSQSSVSHDAPTQDDPPVPKVEFLTDENIITRSPKTNFLEISETGGPIDGGIFGIGSGGFWNLGHTSKQDDVVEDATTMHESVQSLPQSQSGDEAQRADSIPMSTPPERTSSLIARQNELQSTVNQLREDIARVQRRNNALAQQNDALHDEIRSLQARSFGSMGDARWMPMDTQSTKTRLDDIRTKVTAIAKTYAAANLDGIKQASQEDRIRLMAVLEPVVRFKAEGPEAVDELLTIRHASRLCITALISRFVHSEVLESPFFFLDDRLDDEFRSLPPDLVQRLRGRRNNRKMLDDIWSKGCGYDVEKSSVWRSDTLRLLLPLHLAGTEAGDSRIAETRKMIERASSFHATRCLHSGSGLLLKEMDDLTWKSFCDEVHAVFKEAGELSVNLWLQRPHMPFWHMPRISRATFTVRSRHMKAHPLHKLDDPEDHSLDGRPVKILVHPAVFVRGTHEAVDYDSASVLAPAVVYLDV